MQTVYAGKMGTGSDLCGRASALLMAGWPRLIRRRACVVFFSPPYFPNWVISYILCNQAE